MKIIRLLYEVTTLLFMAMISVAAQENPAEATQTVMLPAADNNPSQVQIRQWTDRTALFQGDVVNYYLEVICNNGTDILPGDLDASLLEFNGLELLNSDQSRDEQDDKVIYRIHYQLTTYDLNKLSLLIGARTLRYFSAKNSAQSGTATPTGEVSVPATTLSLRSTLATEPLQSRLRDQLDTEIVPSELDWIRTLGWFLVLISLAPAAWVVQLRLRQRNAEFKQHQIVKAEVQADQSQLDGLHAVQSDSTEQRRQGYDTLNQLVRDLLRQSTGIKTDALTASELTNRLSGKNLAMPTDQIAILLQECEQARYGRPEHLPSHERYAAGVDLLRRLLVVQ